MNRLNALTLLLCVCCITDGLFSRQADALRFHPACALGEADIATVQAVVRTRVLRWFARHRLLTAESAADMQRWAHGGGFSLHAGVLIDAPDRRGLERLLRYCARPALASERLRWDQEDERIRYTLPRPQPDGHGVLTLTPLQFLDRLAALIPPPRRHRHRYHGAFAPNAALRPLVTAQAGQPIPSHTEWPQHLDPPATAAPRRGTGPEPPRRRASYLWAALLARIYECLPLSCPHCAAPMRLIALITEPATIAPILSHLELPATPPPLAPARGPPLWETELDQTPAWDPAGHDQSLTSRVALGPVSYPDLDGELSEANDWQSDSA